MQNRQLPKVCESGNSRQTACEAWSYMYKIVLPHSLESSSELLDEGSGSRLGDASMSADVLCHIAASTKLHDQIHATPSLHSDITSAAAELL